MDSRTIETYTSGAASYAAEWANQPAPDDLYARLTQYFRPHGRTVDIGCGSGRDVAWLNTHGFPAVGYDASEGLIAKAAAEYPQYAFGFATLPELEDVSTASFDNVLCETVIMHLPVAQIGPACRRLVELLRPGGVLYLSWRVTEGDSARDPAGRLYSAFDPALVTGALDGTTIPLSEEAVNRSSGKRVQRIVAIRA
ncbi:class I SAM-dependent methyltransferase [Paraburkholderia acidiphila]|uniref:Methyltransferase domain-containing protein n=1 Tax=Paraburkholderia acidiphila TaxID=2571747 RepID=A0A7Z2JDW9_9BURK|nr:class I SAM-dependent methyltransferase [Paraburkholderia acidiphila]QGZ59874.1 methyltransferase domain-containing protein [Paraburkholderia acidiphila]